MNELPIPHMIRAHEVIPMTDADNTEEVLKAATAAIKQCLQLAVEQNLLPPLSLELRHDYIDYRNAVGIACRLILSRP